MKKGFKKLVIILCAFWVTNVFSQNDNGFYLVNLPEKSSLSKVDIALLDSILPLYHASANDSLRLNLLSTIVETSADDNLWPLYNELIFQKASTGIKNSGGKLKEYYIRKVGDALNNQGFALLNLGEADKALSKFFESLNYYKSISFKKGQATSLNNIGYIYKSKGEIVKAIDYYDQTLKLNEEMGDEAGLANTLNNLGLIYKNQGDVDQALIFYQRSLAYWEKIGSTSNIAACLNNIGFIYSSKGDNEKALKFYKRTLEIDEAENNKVGIANSLNNIGLVYDDKNDYQTALIYYEKSLELARQINHRKSFAESSLNVARIYFLQEKTAKARDLAEQSHRAAEDLGFPMHIKRSAELLSEIYRKKGMYKEASDMQKVFVKMHDSVFNMETQKASLRQQLKYDFEKKETLRKAELHRLAAISIEEKKRNNLIMAVTLGGLMVVITFSAFMFNRYRVTRRQKNIIEQQKALVDSAFDQLSEKNRETMDSIRYAKRIQCAILKEQDHVSLHLPSHFVLFKPKDIVSGDFYWSHERDGIWYLAVGDCTGHGVPGAFLTMLGTAFLNEIIAAGAHLSPAEVLNLLRDKVVKELSQSLNDENDSGFVKDGMDISLLKLDLAQRHVEWAGANNSILIVKGNSFEVKPEIPGGRVLQVGDECIIELLPDKQPIGHYPNPLPFNNKSLSLEQGDSIYLFSDGFADQFGGSQGKKLKHKPLIQKLSTLKSITMKEQKILLEKMFEDWKGDLDQVDDVTVIGIRL